MKIRLLKKIRKQNVVYERNGKYRFICHIPYDSGVWDTDTGWIDDKQYCINLRYETILKIARHEYNPPKKILLN